jgi:hypothetical protein
LWRLFDVEISLPPFIRQRVIATGSHTTSSLPKDNKHSFQPTDMEEAIADTMQTKDTTCDLHPALVAEAESTADAAIDNGQETITPDSTTTPPATSTPLADSPRIVQRTLSMPEGEFERSPSPSLALSPTLALDACPHLDRSVSTASSNSSRSRRSSSSRLSDSGKRRGYMRPQATTYAESAKNRDSVMSLGTIAHLQYYFARTGLLDGKGAQFAKESAQKRKSSAPSSSRASSLGLSDSSNALLSASPGDNYAISESGFTDSPVDQGEEGPSWDGDMMLPPTVSTYNQRPIYVQPPPDVKMLRRELTEALEDALKVLKESDKSPDGMSTAQLIL